jgi:hypothetical protein
VPPLVNRIGDDAAPDWPTGNQNDVYRVDIEGTPSIFQETAFRFTDGSGRDAAAAGCLATGMRALNAVPAVNDLSPGWVTPLDLPLIAGPGATLGPSSHIEIPRPRDRKAINHDPNFKQIRREFSEFSDLPQIVSENAEPSTTW